jgi:hypothetical protein
MGLDEQTFDSFFSQAMTTPTMMATGPVTPQATDLVPTTIKMEDLQVPYDTPSPADSSFHDMMSQGDSTPAPTNADGKPVKKRKSWGQVLPEPKTSLPPRKRAKTEDEKEQRRIERVKRNRLAAHNSRERKRQEYDLLQEEKDRMESDLQSYKDKLAKMEAELKFYRQKYPHESTKLFDPTTITTTASETTDTICPARTSTSFPSPISMDSMDSPRDSSCQPETPASSFEVATPEFDSTQYPAVVLCDLQCRSISGTTTAYSPLAAILAYLTLFNATLNSMRSPASWTTSLTLTSSLKALHPWSPLSAWWTLMSTSMTRTSSATVLPQPLLAFLIALMQSTLTCRMPLAQLMLATRLSQRSSSIEAVGEVSSKGMSETGPVGGGVSRSRLTKSSKPRQLGRRLHVTSLKGKSLGWENTDGRFIKV